MKRLIKYMIVMIVLFSVVALITGCCGYELIAGKVTGGGWFTDGGGNKCTFGFNAQGNEDLEFKGQFQFNDHHARTKIHAKVMTLWEYNCEDNTYKFVGNDKDGNEIVVHVQDNGQPGADVGDKIRVEYKGDEWEGELEGGNIKIH
jgi:hypothetical protein